MADSLIDKLPVKDQERHFSNITHGGKGTHMRKQSKDSIQNYKANSFWDTCEFERNKKTAL